MIKRLFEWLDSVLSDQEHWRAMARDPDYWLNYGRRACAKLGNRDVQAFYDWLSYNDKMLAVYKRNIDESIQLWDRPDCLRLPDGL